MEQVLENEAELDKRKKVVKGVKGPSPLMYLLHFNLIAGFVVDYMHCMLLGAARTHTELILESIRKKFWIRITENIYWVTLF